MDLITDMTMDIYRENTGKPLGFDDIQVVEALSAAIERRIAGLHNLSPAQMTVINNQVPIGCNASASAQILALGPLPEFTGDGPIF